MIPGGLLSGAVSNVTAPVTLMGRIIYEVQPPRINWNCEGEVIRLSGDGKPQDIVLHSCPVPEGWLDSAEVTVSTTRFSKKIIQLTGGETLEPEKSGDTQVFSARLTLISTKLCFNPSVVIEDTEGSEKKGDYVDSELQVVTKSLNLGQQSSVATHVCQPLNVALYIEDCAATHYTWDEKNKVAIAPGRKDGEAYDELFLPPKKCTRKISLRYLHGWAAPPCCWSFQSYLSGEPESNSLGDCFKMYSLPAAAPAGQIYSELPVMYVAPVEKKWIEQGKPLTRFIYCHIGKESGNGAVKVDGYEIYEALTLGTTIELQKLEYKARLKIRIRPSDLSKDNSGNLVCNGVPMDLSRVETANSLVREFDLVVNLKL